MTAQATGAGHTAPHFESNTTARLKHLDEGGDYLKLRQGCMLLRLERKAGRGAIRRAAIANHAGKSTYYEYRDVFKFLWDWRGLSARRTFEDFPELTYTHIRDAIRYPFEDAIDALMAVSTGDDAYPDYDLPMTPDAFRRYLAEKNGKAAIGTVLFDEQGTGDEVWRNLRGRLSDLRDSMIRVIVREGRE